MCRNYSLLEANNKPMTQESQTLISWQEHERLHRDAIDKTRHEIEEELLGLVYLFEERHRIAKYIVDANRSKVLDFREDRPDYESRLTDAMAVREHINANIRRYLNCEP